MTVDPWREQLICRQRLAREEHLDQFIDIESHGDGPAQGNLRLGVPADDRVPHVEIRERNVRRAIAYPHDTLIEQLWFELVSVQHAADIVATEENVIQVTLLEG